ncbi:MAG TPA: sugar ABC transporter permease [Alphaproteobacteria bacterium]|nr:sugar ABC transporter permease [Alphaproteobacteria bacterium]
MADLRAHGGISVGIDGVVSGRESASAGRGPRPHRQWSRGRYIPFVLPALAITLAVIVFPWLFTVFMSVHDWRINQTFTFVGFANYLNLASDERFISALWRTLYYGVLAVIIPVIFGTFAGVIFHKRFPLRGFFRGVFILPMMATPVAVALVWTMMFHPQLGVLNYLLGLAGIPPQNWVYAPDTVIPSLVAVEIWQWTPLVMLIVLGGLAALPTEPYESARIDGASELQMFRHITLPMLLPFIMVAAIVRTIDAVKAFDTIFVISQGGPGTSSETINIYLYLQAFAFYNVGYASAIVVVFFMLIVALSLALLYMRQRTQWM